MKNIQTLLKALSAAAVIIVVACGKEDFTTGDNSYAESENSYPADGQKLVSYELKSSVPAKDEMQALVDSLSIEAPMCFDIDLEEFGIELKAYRISYNTVDVSGNPIILSGDICYIDGGLSGKRLLESVSLFHPAFATAEEDCCEYEQYAFIGRAAHNALVVYPHYQGFFAGSQYRITVSESLLKARQAIDCEIAALELVEKLDEVSMLPCYYTENMGISNGTPAALATQYLLEQDADLKEVDSEWIHLYSTYCCEGPYKYSELITYLANDFPYDDLQDSEDFSQVALVSILVGTFDTWKGLPAPEGGEYFAGIDDVKEYFNPTLFERTDLVDGGTKVTDVVKYFREGKLGHHTDMFKDAKLSSKEMINPAFFTEEGKLDEDNALIKALYAAMARNEVIAEGWKPKTALTISHSKADELCPYSQALNAYKSLSSGRLFNLTVKFNTMCSLTHTKANQFYAIRDIVIKKHP